MRYLIPCSIKINLTLRVLEPRDDGFHDVVSAYLRLRSPETVAVETADRDEVVCVGREVRGENIVTRCLAAMRKRSHAVPDAVRTVIYKSLPEGGGIGAGSGNAAAFLSMADLWEARLSEQEIGALGADVAFLASGMDVALATGRGERLVRVDTFLALRAVIWTPPWQCGTAAMYRALDVARADARRLPMSAMDAAREADDVVRCLSLGGRVGEVPNDFADVQPGDAEMAAEVRSVFSDMGALAWGVCGSGSSLFGAFKTDLEARETLREIERRKYLSENSTIFISG